VRYGGAFYPTRSATGEGLRVDKADSKSGLLLLRDLRKLSTLASAVSIEQCSSARSAHRRLRDGELYGGVEECNAENLRQMKWTCTMIKYIAPQVLTS
jgi:hypothetical protein